MVYKTEWFIMLAINISYIDFPIYIVDDMKWHLSFLFLYI